MTTIQAQVPDHLAQQVKQLADEEHVTLDVLVSTALNSHLSARKHRSTITERAKRADYAAFDRVMEKIKSFNHPPLPGDELPQA